MGHLVESAVGSYLLALANERRSDVHWWREGTDEVDFVISQADDVVAIEVKNGCVKSLKGLAAFVNRFPGARILVVGSAECPLERFFAGEVPLFG